MKTLRLIIVMLLLSTFISCSNRTPNNEVKEAVNSSEAGSSSEAVNNADQVDAYYFHFSARCVTCNTIEAKTKENLELLYPQQFKNGLITFKAVNLDEEVNKPLAQKLGISGQTLLLVKGDEKINITNEGFMYAMVKPEKFKEVINEKVDFLLSK